MENQPINTPLINSLKRLTSLKSELDSVANNCLQIKIIDEISLSVAQNSLSKANSLVKAVENKRVELKQPSLDEGKLIDSTAKSLVEGLNLALKHAKDEIKNWELAKIAEEKRKKDILTKINDISDWFHTKFSVVETIEECNKITEQLTRFPSADYFMEFNIQAQEMKKGFMDLIYSKIEVLNSIKSLPAEDAKLVEESFMAQIEADKEKTKSETSESITKIEIESDINKTSKVRNVWKFEVIDINSVPREWLVVDDKKIREYISNNKVSLKEETINGVKFYKDISISA